MHKNVSENNYFGHVAVPSEVTKVLESNQYQKSDKSLSVIYTDLECLKEKTDWRKNDSQNLFKRKVSEYIPLSFSIFTISWFRSIEKKHEVYKGKDCMKNFCNSLRKDVMKITNFNKSINHMKM